MNCITDYKHFPNFSLVLHYLYTYICILNVFIYVYGQLSTINNLNTHSFDEMLRTFTFGFMSRVI